MAGAVTRRKARDRPAREGRDCPAERQKRCRARQRAGLVLVSFEVDAAHLTSVLLALGKLAVKKAEDRTALNKATRELVESLTVADVVPSASSADRPGDGGVYLPFDRNSAGELAGLLAAIGAYAAGGVPALERAAVPRASCFSNI